MDQRIRRSLPNKAVDVVACQTFFRSLVFRVLNSCPTFRSRSSEFSCRLLFAGLCSSRLSHRSGCSVVERLIDFASHPKSR